MPAFMVFIPVEVIILLTILLLPETHRLESPLFALGIVFVHLVYSFRQGLVLLRLQQ